MRIPSGSTDRKIYLVAVDPGDLVTRKTGLTTFTVYRARDGGAAVLYTTPVVTEVSAANMPGVYSLLLDEDTSLAAGHDNEEMVLHVTQAAMAPVSRAVELYRPKSPEGGTDAVGLLDLADGVETGVTIRQALRLTLAVLAGKVSGAGTTTEVFRAAVADHKVRLTTTSVPSTGDRTAVATDST